MVFLHRFCILLSICNAITAPWHMNAFQLYEDLIKDYNKNVLPNKNTSDEVTVKFGAFLIRIIDVNEKLQELTTSLWLEMQWTDAKMTWDPREYGGITKMHIPAEHLWRPDIILYDNSDGDPHITIMGNADVHSDGTVVWKPPAIFRSVCKIDTAFFPYDTQQCRMKFGTWANDGRYVNIIHATAYEEIGLDENGFEKQYQAMGMDISYYEQSAEWDLLNLTNTRNTLRYGTCCGSRIYYDIRFNLTLRRRSLFFTVFFVVPCVLIASLTTFAFYLPSKSTKKLTLSVGIFTALIVFLTALVDIIPPNSEKMPLIAQYILFTMVLVFVSIIVNTIVSNVHFRSSDSHHMPRWLQKHFLHTVPKLLRMKIPQWHEEDPLLRQSKLKIRKSIAVSDRLFGSMDRRPSPYFSVESDFSTLSVPDVAEEAQRAGMRFVIRRMIAHVHNIADHFATLEDSAKSAEDWLYVALAIDRILLWIFTLANVVGCCIILLRAPIFDPLEELKKTNPEKPLGHDTYEQDKIWAIVKDFGLTKK